jgi:hypothetical protein
VFPDVPTIPNTTTSAAPSRTMRASASCAP